MPKLRRHVLERNQRHIEQAALHLFTCRGYHGTSMREIANAADVSLGNLYNYYRTKEELFTCLVRRYEERIEALRQKALGPLRDIFEPTTLRRLAKAIRAIVYENPDYWRLMYLDIIEFGNRHFAHTFRSLAGNMKARLRSHLNAAARRKDWNGIDPALAFTAIYLQFFTYFLVEKLFGGEQHLGMPDDRAIAQLIRMVTEGLWRSRAERAEAQRRRVPS